MSERTWTGRPYREGDEEGIFRLVKAVYQNAEYDYDKWHRRWYWLNNTNPAGNSIMCIAEDDNRIVGYDAAVCMKMKLGESQVTGANGVDAMTHPEHRRQGIFTALRRKKHDECETRGIKLTYGFGGKGESFAISKRYFGAQYIHTTSVLIRPLNWHNLMKSRTQNRILIRLGVFGGTLLQGTINRVRKITVPSDLLVRRVSEFDERINDFWTVISKRYQIMRVRNQVYLNWRYVSIPDIEYSILIVEREKTIVGYLVFRTLWWQGVNVSIIFDMLAESQIVAECLIKESMKHAQSENADLVYCNIMGDRQIISSLKNNGFMALGFAGHGLMGDFIAADIPKEFVLNPGNWYVQIGDTDFF